jgi:alpha-mannosidase
MNKVSRVNWTSRGASWALLSFALVNLQAQTRTVWQIGKFDQSPVEFQGTASAPAVYEVGKSDWRKDWPGEQSVDTPRSIVFSLESVRGTYTLKITVLVERPRVPAMRLEINGHAGTFYLHPKLSYSRSDFTYAFDPHESQSELSIQVPPTYLKAGQNTLMVDPVDEPASSAEERRESGITFDALSLSQDPEGRFKPELQADVLPTVFYRGSGAALVELVDTFVRLEAPAKGGFAKLELAGHSYESKLNVSDGFGEQRLTFEVPAWTGTVPATLDVKAGAHKSFKVSLAAERKWTIFVVPHTHLDIGYSDYQGKVAEIQSRVLSQAGSLVRQYPDFRFSFDGSWVLQQCLETRAKPQQDELLGLIRDGKMSMPAQYVNVLTGYASLETLYRSLYTSKKLSRTYGLPYEYANITDVPTYSGSYPSILAASGIKYWAAAANNDRAPIFNYEHWNEKSPFWWEGPDGKKVLFWYSRHYMQAQALFGLPPQLAAVRESLPIFLQAYSKPTYKPDVALIFGTQVENTDLFPSTATFATDWNKSYAYPKLQYATFPDFFHYLDEHYSKDLPTFKGDGGGYWEDGIGSDAYYAAEDRRNQNRALSAEILSSLTHSLDTNLHPPNGIFDDIWRNIVLFSEHTWLSYNSVSQPDHEESIRQLRVKDDRATRASIEIQDVMNRSLSQLAEQIHIPANTLVVFNPLNWRRDAMVEADLNPKSKLVDMQTGQDVPLDVVFAKEDFIHVRFLAKELPAVGYKCYSIASGGDSSAAVETSQQQTVENAFYRVKIDESTGSVASIFDKQLRRELVDTQSPYKFGEYVYVTGGDGDTQMINPFPALAPGDLTVHHASKGQLVGVERLAWGQSIRLTSSNINTPKIDTEILLFDKEKKIEFHYHVHKLYTNKKEGVYFSFPVAVSTPSFTFATQQAWVDPARDIMKGGSLEWFNVQGWMAAHDASASVGIVPVDASLASFGDINRGKWPGVFEPKSGTMFSYVMNNYWHTNYRAGQDGDFEFRYAMTSAPELDGTALSRLSAEEMRPAELDHVVDQDKAGNPERPLPKEGESFLETSAPNIVVSTWKMAEDGAGTIMRLTEIGGKGTTARIHFLHLDIKTANLSSGVEDNEAPITVDDNTLSLTFKPFEVLTVRIRQ